MEMDSEKHDCHRFRVLVIDDNPGDRRLAEISLKDGARDAGSTCDVLSAESLSQGEDLVAEEAGRVPDAILLDLGLPDSTGFEALGRLSLIAPNTPILILTGQDDSEAAANALKFGAADYLEKADLRPRALWRAVSYAVFRKQYEAELVQLAATDPLTGLKNRRAMFEILEQAVDQARRSELHCAVLIFDINNFKQINDLLGHDAGDKLLKMIAARVTRVLRKTDAIGRLGGDEFAVIASNLKSPGGAIEIAEKICSAIASVTAINEKSVVTAASIGIAVLSADCADAETLISHADLAMYKAKREKGSQICFYDETMHRDMRYRHTLKKAMIDEIATPSFYLEYQPIVDAKTHAIIGAEGLARWVDHDNKVIMPREFIPIAEENGWISTLGMKLIERACEFLGESLEANLPVVPISINVSPIQCRDSGFPLHVTSTILKYGISPELINIEITESTVMQNIDTARQSLKIMQDAGIGIHIDDFGTGYSSLAMLKDLPLHHLKIDRSFVTQMLEDDGTRRIMETIADLANKLNFKTVAEGVETIEQAETLQEINIDYLQGYYFSRPVSAMEFREKLAGKCAESGGGRLGKPTVREPQLAGRAARSAI